MKYLSFEELELPNDAQTRSTTQRWLDRGDGIAVYENVDLSHPMVGHRQFVSFGSPEAQLETDDPPNQLPDIGGSINWRYYLRGVYRPSRNMPGEGPRVTIIAVDSIRRCPHFIMTPEHYREDGSCRCDDPTHFEMAGWGYKWHSREKRWM